MLYALTIFDGKHVVVISRNCTTNRHEYKITENYFTVCVISLNKTLIKKLIH